MTAEGKGKAGRKLLGAETSVTRRKLIDATASLVREQGYPAATAREIAKRAGMKHQLIFYYFDDLEALLIEVYRTHAAKWIEQVRAGLQSSTPLRTFWDAMRDPQEQIFLSEFMALSQHNHALRREMITYAEESRRLLIETLGRSTAASTHVSLSPDEITFVMSAVARQLISEQQAGLVLCHEAGEDLMTRLLDQLEPRPAADAARFE